MVDSMLFWPFYTHERIPCAYSDSILSWKMYYKIGNQTGAEHYYHSNDERILCAYPYQIVSWKTYYKLGNQKSAERYHKYDYSDLRCLWMYGYISCIWWNKCEIIDALCASSSSSNGWLMFGVCSYYHNSDDMTLDNGWKSHLN